MIDASKEFRPSVLHCENQRTALRNEALLQAEKHHTDPRDELNCAISMAREFDWKYVRVPLWIAQLALQALHPFVQSDT